MDGAREDEGMETEGHYERKSKRERERERKREIKKQREHNKMCQLVCALGVAQR